MAPPSVGLVAALLGAEPVMLLAPTARRRGGDCCPDLAWQCRAAGRSSELVRHCRSKCRAATKCLLPLQA
jgi:hypothetical protein